MKSSYILSWDHVYRRDSNAAWVASACYGGTMSDTPDGERDPLPASRGRRARGTAAEATEAGNAAAARDRGPGRPARRAEAAGRHEAAGRAEAGGRNEAAGRAEAGERSQARHRIGIRELRQEASVYVDLA